MPPMDRKRTIRLSIALGVAVLLAAIPVLVVAYSTSAWLVGRRVLRNRSTSPWVALLAGWGILRVLALLPFAGAAHRRQHGVQDPEQQEREEAHEHLLRRHIAAEPRDLDEERPAERHERDAVPPSL